MRERAEAHGDTVYTKSHIQKHGDGNRWNESLRLSQTLPLSPARAHTLLSCSLAYTHTHAYTHTSRHTKRARVAYLTLQCLITLITPAEIFDKRSLITARAVLPLSSHNMAAADTNCLEESRSHYHI